MISFNWEYGSLLATLTMVLASFVSCASTGCANANLSPAQSASRRENLNTNADFVDRIVASAAKANATVVGDVEIEEPRGELYQGLRLGGVKAKLFVFLNPAANNTGSLPSPVPQPSPSPSSGAVSGPANPAVDYPPTIPTVIVTP